MAVLLVVVALIGGLSALRRPGLAWDWVLDGGAAVQAPPTWFGDLAFLSTADGFLLALERQSGATLWSRSLGFPLLGPVACGAGRVWALDGGGVLHGLSLATGAPDIRRPLGGSARAGTAFIDGRVLVSTDDRRLIALQGRDGSPLWETGLPDTPLQAPMAAEDASLLLLPTHHGLVVVEAAQGRVTARLLDDALWGGTTLREGEVWRGNDRGEVCVWRPAAASSGWSRQRILGVGTAVRAAPWVDDEILLVGTVAGEALCFERAGGRARWRARTRGRVVARPVRTGSVSWWGTVDGWLEVRSLADGRLVCRAALGGPVGTDLQTDGDRIYSATWGGRWHAVRRAVSDRTRLPLP